MLAYADDMVVHAPRTELYFIYQAMMEVFPKFGLSINTKKSELMLGPEKDGPVIDLSIPRVVEFKYLGTLIRHPKEQRAPANPVTAQVIKANVNRIKL